MNYLKSKKTLLSALALCLLSGSLMIAFAQRPGGPPMGGPPEMFGRLIDLSDAQKEQIKAIRERAATASKPHHEALKPLEEQARALTEAAAFDEAAFRALAAQMSPIQTELHVIQSRAQVETYNVLTAEQKAKLAEMREKMKERGGPGGRPGPAGFGRPGIFGFPIQ